MYRGVSASKPAKFYQREVTVVELIKFYGLIIMMESTYRNDTHDIREHFKKIKQSEGAISKLGIDRFQVLRKAFDLST